MNAFRQALQRLAEVWRQAWGDRHSETPLPRDRHELEFLPAALALQETPVHPLPRHLQRSIVLLVLLALAWATFGKVDVIAVANGKIVAAGKSKVIQADTTAMVKAIHVEDGQRVRAGQLLVELDPAVAEADIEKMRGQALAAQIDQARAEAMLEAIQSGKPPGPLDKLGQADSTARGEAEAWLHGQYLELRSQLDQSEAVIAQRTAEADVIRASIASLQQTLPIAEQMAEDYRGLVAGKFVARHAWLERERAVLVQRQDLAAERARLQQAIAARREAQDQRASLLAQNRRNMLDLRQDAMLRANGSTQELHKAEQRGRLTRLTAPVDGTIQQLAIHSNSAVVTPAQELMLVVPSDQPVEIEAFIENRDSGFVWAGQRANIKVETFNFTRYGFLDGQVTAVSSDAIADEKHGLRYATRIRLAQNHIHAEGRNVALSPGMAVRAEIHIGRRRIVSYFLSPLQQHLHESLKER